MSEFIYIYIYTVLQNISTIMWFVIFIGTITATFMFLNSKCESDYTFSYPNGKEDHNKLKGKLIIAIKSKFLSALFIVLFIITIFLPSESDVKTIIAGGLIWKAGGSFSEVEGIKDLPDNVVNAMNSFLEGVQDSKSE